MKYEIRDGRLHLTGYVNAVERDSKEIMTKRGRCVEQIRSGAFAKSLERNPEVRMKLNHKRTVSADMTLREDNIGLHVEADTDDEEIMALAAKGELRGWSFGFEALDDEIEQRDGRTPRRIVKDLDLSEVSVLSVTPAYNGTSLEYRDVGEDAARRELAYQKAVNCLIKHGIKVKSLKAMEFRKSSDTELTNDNENDKIDLEERENKIHMPAGTPQGGQFASKDQQALFKAITDGTVSSKLNKAKQAKHKKDSQQYKEAVNKGEMPSYTELSYMDIQTIINNNCGKGRIIISGDQFKEIIDVGHDFGFFGDRVTNKSIPTRKATIHYSKDGAHLVPTHPDAKTE